MKKNKKSIDLIRLPKKYSPEMVFAAFPDYILFSKYKQKILFDGDLIKSNSQRLQTFKLKGCTCVRCGLVGTYFVKEKHANDGSYHLNLYGVDKDGKEILFTKDHIIPKSKGGIDDISNYQTVCVKCNMSKGNNEESYS